jgi:hypothetical protein
MRASSRAQLVSRVSEAWHVRRTAHDAARCARVT